MQEIRSGALLRIVSVMLLSAFAAGLSAAETVRRDGERAPAKQILEATGVQGGLIVHLGCGDGKLTAALRAGDSYLVHGLDTDAEKIRQARKRLRSLNVYGNVSVDRFDGKRLPGLGRGDRRRA